jgi:Protein of unknown function (DUF669)
MSMQRKRLSDIVSGSVENFKKTWDETEASEGFTPLPAGLYRCLITGGEMFTSKKNETPGYKITFEVTTGPLAGRKIWHDVWLTDKALSMAKAELAKIGIAKPDQFDQPLPPGMIADVKVVLRTDDDGDSYNRVKTFQVIKADVPAADFAPSKPAKPETPKQREAGDDDDLDDEGFDWSAGEQNAAPVHTNGQPVTTDAGRGAR